MSGRPKHPKYARNKNVIVIGGSGSGKTRFYVKPNLMQMPEKVSYVLTDPKGTIIVECGKMLSDAGYKIKVLNTINFKKSMRYNPFHYIRSEKDILKLVNTIIANTKGDGEKSGEDFWVKSERLLYCALIGYIWYEAPEEEQNFSTLLEFINASEAREDDEEFKNAVDELFEEEAKKIGAVDFLAQGTIYPDVVESGLGGESAVIKSHHNVGGLPDFVDFKEIIEPLRDLFKDEVRKAGLELGIPERLIFRQPFPGPGLGIRIIGEVTEEKVRIVQDADYIYREEVDKAAADYKKEHGEDPSWMPNQYFAALTNMRSVGVMGDFRTYDYAVALRAVKTIDFMTAESAEIPYEVLNRVMNRVINEVKGVNRVFYDLTSKPPGTIEFE